MVFRRKARSPEARHSDHILPEAEMEVLAAVHARGEADAREIREALASYRSMLHASVLTLLGRLEAKGLVNRRKAPVGKAFRYTAARSPRPVYRSLLKRLVQRLFTNDPSRLVATLFDATKPSPEELRRIRQLVDEMEARKKT
jgi:BlaI family transcriptional regulator, penicillinase repressor